jgi:hypothetical protein
MHTEKDLFGRFSLGLEPRFPAKFAVAAGYLPFGAGAGEFD